MNDTVTIRLNKSRLLENLRFAFSNRYTVVTELMQNARRAGATCVALDYARKAKRLTVRDDGCGIASFQTLFTLGESGWSEALARTEHPFGLGFVQALYSAGRCTVESRGLRARFDTRAALAGAAIGIERGGSAHETVVTLEDIELPEMDRRIVRLARGFPIAVQYNGVALRRPHSPDVLPYASTAIGKVYLAGWEGGQATRESAVYLQGLRVEGPEPADAACNVVHLDSARFRARLPDRDRLIDQDEELQRVERVLKALWRERLAAVSRAVQPDAFTARFFQAARVWGHVDVFNDMPAVPEGLLRRVVGYPRRDPYGEQAYLTPFRRAVSRADLESGRIRLACLSELGERNLAQWLYARERAYFVVDEWALDAGHWMNRCVRRLEEEPASIEVVNPGAGTIFEGRRIKVSVRLCEAVAIRVGDDTVVIRDDGVFCPASNTILVPEGEQSGQAVRQAASYLDDRNHWREEDEQADCAALTDAIALLRSTNPAGALLRLLAEARPERYPSLRGRRFTVEVGATLEEHRVASDA